MRLFARSDLAGSKSYVYAIIPIYRNEGKILLDRKIKDKTVKTIRVCWFDTDEAYLHIEVEE